MQKFPTVNVWYSLRGAMLLLLSVLAFFIVTGQSVSRDDKIGLTKSLEAELATQHLGTDLYREFAKFRRVFLKRSQPEIDEEIVNILSNFQSNKYDQSTHWYTVFRVLNRFYAGKLDLYSCRVFCAFIGRQLYYDNHVGIKEVLRSVLVFLQDQSLYNPSGNLWQLQSEVSWKFTESPNFSISMEDPSFLVQEEHVFTCISAVYNCQSNTLAMVDIDYTLESENINWDLDYCFHYLQQRTIESGSARVFDSRIHSDTLQGKFSLRLKGKEMALPVFESYERIALEQKNPVFTLKSGVRIEGSEYRLVSSEGGSSQIIFSPVAGLSFELLAQEFLMEDVSLYSKEAILKVRIGKDSILHPNVVVQIRSDPPSFKATTTADKLGNTPFYNSLHDLQIRAKTMEWIPQERAFQFINRELSQLNPVEYQSLEFFDVNWFIDLFDLGETHPSSGLIELYRSYDRKRKTFSLDEVAETYGISRPDAYALVTELCIHGLIEYNVFSEVIRLNKRLFSFAQAQSPSLDYDKIRIESLVTNRPSSKLYLEDSTLRINHVRETFLSIPHRASIHPSDRELVLYPNKNIRWNGMISCGKFALWGQGMLYDYSKHLVSFSQADSLKWLLPNTETKDSLDVLPSKMALEECTGELLLDTPKNKSGKKKRRAYPKIILTEPAFVYYDKIKGGLYPREEFYFEVSPTKWTHIKEIETDTIALRGTLHSSIFPEISETLHLLDSQLYGFERQQQEYPAYKGHTANLALFLSDTGFWTSGTIGDKQHVYASKHIEMYPSYSQSSSGDLALYSQGNPLFPDAEGKEVALHWFVDEEIEEYIARSKDILVEKQSALRGGLEIREQSRVTGYGTLIDENILMHSDSLVLEDNYALAIDAFSKVYPEGSQRLRENEVVLESKQNTVALDYTKDIFFNIATDSAALYSSPFLRYDFSFELFTYERERRQMFLESEQPSGAPSVGEVVVKNPLVGELAYLSEVAIVDMNTHKVYLDNIEGLAVGNARVIPEAKEYVLERNGIIETLTNASITVNGEGGEALVFKQADVDILDKNHLLASANLMYTNRAGSLEEIFFDSLYMDDRSKLQGRTSVSFSDELHWDPQGMFEGELIFSGDTPQVFADGITEFTLPCGTLASSEFEITGPLSPNGYRITPSKSGDSVPTISLLLEGDVWRMNHGVQKDKKALLSFGAPLSYSDSTESLIWKNRRGEAIVSDQCALRYSGPLQLGEYFSDGSVLFGALAFEEYSPDSIALNTLLGLQLEIPIPIKRRLVDAAKLFFSEMPYTSDASEISYQFIRLNLGEKESERYLQSKRKGRAFVPKEMQFDLLLTDIDWTWDKKERSFLYQGEIELQQLAKSRIDRTVEGSLVYSPMEHSLKIVLENGDDYIALRIQKDDIGLGSSLEMLNTEIQKETENSTSRISFILAP